MCIVKYHDISVASFVTCSLCGLFTDFYHSAHDQDEKFIGKRNCFCFRFAGHFVAKFWVLIWSFVMLASPPSPAPYEVLYLNLHKIFLMQY